MSISQKRVRRPPREPLMVYDGDCNFCRFWIARWRERTGRRIDYRRSQQVAERFPEIPHRDFEHAVQLIEPDGTVTAGSDAVFRAFEISGSEPFWLRALRRIPGFSKISRIAYRFIAAHRMTFSIFTRVLWGSSFRRPTFFIARWVFLRLLGAIYFVAFLSLLVQVRGLIGRHGILPAADYLNAARAQLGPERHWLLPTVCWWSVNDVFLIFLCVAGAVLSLAVVFNFLPCLSLILLWALYLSLSVVGQTFLGYQWDALLLETGFLAIFLVPPLRLLPDWRVSGSGTKIAHLALLWLLFRLMFESGVVKLNAPPSENGVQTWRALTALNYHYETQPLPIWTSWYLNQSPLDWEKFSVLVMFAIELGAPLTMIGPTRVRRLGCAAMLGLQAMIAISGNYCFFNYLTAGLCLLLIDDDAWPARWRKLARPAFKRPGGWSPWIAGPVAATSVAVTTMQLFGAFDLDIHWPAPLMRLYNAVAPLRSFNSYGLFAVMTTSRPEIIVEGSNDGVAWTAYEFKWKPGDVWRRPRLVAPHQPRLDWQMWFASLGTVRDNPWFVNFLERLLEGTPEVLDLLGHNPFPNKPPRYVRALVYDYKFTRSGESEAWWKRELIGTYCPPISLSADAPAAMQ